MRGLAKAGVIDNIMRRFATPPSRFVQHNLRGDMQKNRVGQPLDCDPGGEQGHRGTKPASP
jgi:hypothetical protein